jgi:MFS family permease
MGLVNMLGILMILGGAPLVGHLADLSGNFRVSFVVLGAFALLVCAAVIPFIQSAEPALPQTRA